MLISGAIRVLDNPLTRDKLTFPNPFDEQEFHAFTEKPPYILVPRAFIEPDVYELDVVDNSAEIVLKDGYSLRDYQEPIVEGILKYFTSRTYGQCLLQADTGSGKSFSLSAVLAGIGRTTLILSHLTMLGDQIKKEMEANLDASIGVITAKSFGEPLPDIGICSFKLLENTELLLWVAKFYSFVVVDEMENCMTPTRLNVLFTLRPVYQLYLTATPSKELVQQTKAVQYMYDEVFLMKQPEETKVHSKHLMVDFSHLRWESPQNPMMYKTSLGRFFTHSEILPWIVKLCHDLKAQGLLGTIWIVADLNKLQDQLEKRLVKQGLTVGIIRGDTRKKQRDLILGQIADRQLDVLVGSAPLSAGVSIPELSVGIRVMPNSSSEELLEQQKGRLGRRCDFKSWQTPAWIDLRITGSLEYGAKKRFRLYKEATLGVKMVKPMEVLKEIL